MYENDLDLDNLYLQDDTELEEDTGAEGDQDDDDDESGQPAKGNLAKALQEERAARKEFEKKLSDAQQELQRANAFLSRLGQGQQRQVDPEQHRAQLQQFMLERPDEFVNSIQQRTEQRMLQRFAPTLARDAEYVIQKNPEHKAAYEIPEIREVVDAFVMNEIQTGGIEDFNDLQEVVGKVMDGVLRIRGAAGLGKTAQDPAKQRLSTTVGKGGGGNAQAGRKSVEEVWAEKRKLARTNRTEYMKWASSPEGKKVRNALLSGQ